MSCPKYLEKYKAVWEANPKEAALTWFADAKYGLFLHYGLYSMLHKHEWSLNREKIPLAEYEKLSTQFTAHNFDADRITDLAIKAGMKYITLTTCHHEGFCLWDSKVEPFNSMNCAGRDLVGELSEACDKKGLGFFAYYTFMLNWRHPYFLSTKELPVARPAYDFDEPRYLYRTKEDFKIYISYVEEILDELLSKYKITGVWFDLIVAWYKLGEEYIPIEQIYDNIRKKHPNVLISWKQGATGTEDFAAPEHSFNSMADRMSSMFGEESAKRAQLAFEKNKGKHNEICASVQKDTWGYNPMRDNYSADEIYRLLGNAYEHNCNLLLNVGPMADGSINPRHEQILLDIADRIKTEGFPTTGDVLEKTNVTAGAE